MIKVIYYLTELDQHILDTAAAGAMQDKSADAISDEELLSQFRKIEKLPDDKKKLVKEFLDAFIFKAYLQKQVVS